MSRLGLSAIILATILLAMAQIAPPVVSQLDGLTITVLPAAQQYDFPFFEGDGGMTRYVLPTSSDWGVHISKAHGPRSEWVVVGAVHVDDAKNLPGAQYASGAADVSLIFAFAWQPDLIAEQYWTCDEVQITGNAWYPETAIEMIHNQARQWTDNGYNHVGDECPDPEPEW